MFPIGCKLSTSSPMDAAEPGSSATPLKKVLAAWLQFSWPRPPFFHCCSLEKATSPRASTRVTLSLSSISPHSSLSSNPNAVQSIITD